MGEQEAVLEAPSSQSGAKDRDSSVLSGLAKPVFLALAFVAGLFIASVTFNLFLYWSLRSRGAISSGLGAPVGAAEVYKNIVSIEVQFATYNRVAPWQTVRATFQPDLKLASAAAASGLILEKGLILTSAYVATDSYLVTVLRQGETRKYEAMVVAHARELDLALLKVQDKAFWSGVDTDVELDAAAQVLGRGNQVIVAGFPVGEELSISKLSARVARVESTASGLEGRYGSYPQVVLSLYPAIGAGLTVGPVFQERDDKLIGFIGKNDKVIPVATIANFVKAYQKDHSIAGVGSLGMLYRPMRPLAMRMYWDLPIDSAGQQVGVQIRSVDPASQLNGTVQKGDVLVAIDGTPVLANGAVNYRKSVDNTGQINDVALPLSVLLAEKAVGDEVKLSFRRATEKDDNDEGCKGYKKSKDFETAVKMQQLNPLAPRTLGQKTLEQPTYFMLGGLVFTVFTEELVIQSAHLGVHIPSATIAGALHRWRENPDEQVVVLLRALEHPCNKWYDTGSVRILRFFNGKPVLNMKSFVSSVGDALKDQTELLKFTFAAGDDEDLAGSSTDPDMVLDTSICAGADKDLMGAHAVQAPTSPDLLDIYQTLPASFTLMPTAEQTAAPKQALSVHLPKKNDAPKSQKLVPLHRMPEEVVVKAHEAGNRDDSDQQLVQRELHALPWTNVVQIQLVSAEHDFTSPWKMEAASAARCSAIIVSKAKRMILTNSHCVGDAVALYVLREDVPVPVPAKVVEIAHDVDLAWITTDVDSFWASKDIQDTVNMAEGLPYISHGVRVVGYPRGGSSISITEGIVSRIDAQTYPNGLMDGARNTPNPLLIVQVDAAINPGNSGGPVFDAQGKLVGLAFAGMPGAQSVGYVIPHIYLRNFVASITSANFGHRWKAQSETGARFRRVENAGLRKFLHLQEDETGVQVRSVAPYSPLAKHGIVKGDVLLSIDGMQVQGSGRVERNFNGKKVTLPFGSIVTEKEHGTPTVMEFVHLDPKTGERTRKSVNAVFGPVAPLIPRFYDAPAPVKGREHFAAYPSYFVLWGLVWGVFSNPVYQQAVANKKEVPWTVLKNALHRWRASDDEEVVVLLQGLGGSACTLNYNTDTMRILQYFNGRKVNNMRDLARYAIESEVKKDDFMRITFAPLADADVAGSDKDPDIVLHRSLCATTDQEVLRANGIPQQFSDDVYAHAKEALEEQAKLHPAQQLNKLLPGSLVQSESQEVLSSLSGTRAKSLRAAPLLNAIVEAHESSLGSAQAAGNVESIPALDSVAPDAERIARDGVSAEGSVFEAKIRRSRALTGRATNLARGKAIRDALLTDVAVNDDYQHLKIPKVQ